MFDPTSRYVSSPLKTMKVLDAAGQPREIRYIQRRLIPPAGGLNTLVQHTFVQGDRLDVIATRYLGDPTQFWRICDANEVLSPAELAEPGHVITIAVPHI